MGRPTTEKKDKTVKLRISEELYEEVVKKGDNVSETIRKMIKSGVDGVPQKKTDGRDNVPQNKEESSLLLKEIESVMPLIGVKDLEEFFKKLIDAINEGTVLYEGGRFYSQSNEDVNLSRFKEACDAKGMDYQKTVDKMTQIVWQS